MLEDQPATLDPGQTQYSYETAVLRAISEPLLKPNAELTGVAPAAAQSYEANDAGTAYVFHLRSAAKYWDGTPVKAQDFVYAWQRLIDPRLAAYNETLFADAVLNGQRVSLMDPQRDGAAIDGALGTLGLKAVDDLTFQVQLAHPPASRPATGTRGRSEEHTSELQSLAYLVCRLLLEKKKNIRRGTELVYDRDMKRQWHFD